MLADNVIETGNELVQPIDYENRTRQISEEILNNIVTPQSTLSTIIHGAVEIKMSEKCLVDTKYLNELEKKVVEVTNWILGPAEQLLNANHKVGYDVKSSEELRREHESIELQCWETYGMYAELLHKIGLLEADINDNTSSQCINLMSQKEFMDFVCRSFALRVEKRRNIIITSMRFYRLVSEYFDQTGDVFDLLVTGSNFVECDNAPVKLKQLQENQLYLDSLEQEIRKEGEKLTDMLSMPVKDALGKDILIDYSEDICIIHDVLDATAARKNIFSDSVEIQKLTFQQISLISRYEKYSNQAILWLEDILRVILKDHGHVGCSIFEIEYQKDEHLAFQETSKCIYSYGCQLLKSSLQLRKSCKIPVEEHAKIFNYLKSLWSKIDTICFEQMTRLRVSAVFHKSVEKQCNQLRIIREAVATIPLLNLTKKKSRIKHYFTEREKLLLEVGRMVRLGRLLKERLKEPLYEQDQSTQKNSVIISKKQFLELSNSCIKNNEVFIQLIAEKLSEVTQLSEELDQALESARQDLIIFSTTSSSSSSIETDNNVDIKKPFAVMDGKPIEEVNTSEHQTRSDDEFYTASDTTLQHSRSSSFNTASDCDNGLESWMQHGKIDLTKNISEKRRTSDMGCLIESELTKKVLDSPPKRSSEDMTRSFFEPNGFKKLQHNFDMMSFEASSSKNVAVNQTPEIRKIPSDKEHNDMNVEEIVTNMGLFQENVWAKYTSYRSVTKQTIKNFVFS